MKRTGSLSRNLRAVGDRPRSVRIVRHALRPSSGAKYPLTRENIPRAPFWPLRKARFTLVEDGAAAFRGPKTVRLSAPFSAENGPTSDQQPSLRYRRPPALGSTHTHIDPRRAHELTPWMRFHAGQSAQSGPPGYRGVRSRAGAATRRCARNLLGLGLGPAQASWPLATTGPVGAGTPAAGSSVRARSVTPSGAAMATAPTAPSPRTPNDTGGASPEGSVVHSW